MNLQQQIIIEFLSIADTLRGSLPSDIVAECPATLFFLKRLTDMAAAGSMERIPVENPEHFINHFRTFSWSDFPHKGNAGHALLTELEQIEQALPMVDGLSNGSRLAQALTSRSDLDEHFKKVFSLLGEINTGELSAQEAAAIFQSLLDSMAERAESSVTPPSVRRLLIALLNPQPGDRVYDPVCGCASLLCSAASKVVGSTSPMRLAGQELNASTLLLARMNLLLHGSPADLCLGDTLQAPAHSNKTAKVLQKFDVVLANPPFGLKLKAEDIAKDEYQRFAPVQPSSSELAFVLHVLASLAPKGRAAVLVPNGILFRGGNDGIVRQNLVETGRIAAIVALPPYLFSGTPISASVLVLRGVESASQQKTCLFVDLSAHAEGPITRRHLSERGIEESVRCVKQPTSIPGFSNVVPQEVIKSNAFNLSVGRYVRISAEHGLLSVVEEMRTFMGLIERRNVAETEALRLVRHVRPTASKPALEESSPN